MATIYGTEKTRELFENIPEFNSGSISYSRFQFGNVGFGNNTDVINISSAQFDFITSLSLSIELPALTTANHITHPGGYISWINNVGHAIIENIRFEINDNILISSDFPYGYWLDIYNELNDIDNSEYGQLGKFEDNREKEIYNNQPISLEVPLHLWMSDYTRNAFPFFLLENGTIKIRIKLRGLSEIIYFNPGNSASVVAGIQPIMNLNVGYYQINDANLKVRLQNQNYTLYFNSYSHRRTAINNDDGLIDALPTRDSSNPIKQIDIIFVDQGRDTGASSFSDPGNLIQINSELSDVNNNDYFNYGRTALLNGDIHSFSNLQFKYNNIDYFDNELNAAFIQNTYSRDNNISVPIKKIYPISFTPRPHDGELYGLLDVHPSSSLTFQIGDIHTGSNMYIFYTQVVKMNIFARELYIDNWGTRRGNFRSSGFRFADSHLDKTTAAICEAQERAEEINDEIERISSQSTIYDRFLVIGKDNLANGLFLTVMVGDNISFDVINKIRTTLDKGSVEIYGMNTHLLTIETFESIKTGQSMGFFELPPSIKLPLLTNINTLSSAELQNKEVKDLLQPILPYSDALYINENGIPRELNSWLLDESIDKKTDNIITIINNLKYGIKKGFDRVYKLKIGSAINQTQMPYIIDPAFSFPELNRQLISLTYRDVVPEEPALYLMPAVLHPIENSNIHVGLTENEIIDLLSMKISFTNGNITINDGDILTYFHNKFNQTVPNNSLSILFTQAQEKYRANDIEYSIFYERLKEANNFFKLLSDILNPNVDVDVEPNPNYRNHFLVYKNVNTKYIINGLGESTIQDVNERLKRKIFTKIEVDPGEHLTTFHFIR